MKRSFIVLVLIVFVASIATMLGLHWRQSATLGSRLQQVELQNQKQDSAQRLVFELEQFRTQNANFKRMFNDDIRAAKTRISTTVSTITAELEKGTENPTPIEQIRTRFTELQVLAAKLEPQLYSRNVYQNAEIQQLHASMIKDLQDIAATAKQNAETARAAASGSLDKSKKIFIAAAATACAMLLLLIGYGVLMHVRPIRSLQRRVEEIRAGRQQDARQRSLKGIYGELEQLVRDFMTTIATHRRERMDFVTAVVTDLRSPLQSLRGAAEIFTGSDDRLIQDPALRTRAVEATRSALYRLDSVLDGLNDILDSGEGTLKLEEQITDLGQLLVQTSRILKTDKRDVSVNLPPLPVWARMDRDRFEHLMIYLGSKFMDHGIENSKLFVDVAPLEDKKGGLLITFYDQVPGVQPQTRRTGRDAANTPASTGPEQELLKHWATQRGFGMALADRIMRSHGGTVTAAGVAGTRLIFKIWLPAERISLGVVSQKLTTMNTGLKVMDLSKEGFHEVPASLHPMN